MERLLQVLRRFLATLFAPKSSLSKGDESGFITPFMLVMMILVTVMVTAAYDVNTGNSNGRQAFSVAGQAARAGATSLYGALGTPSQLSGAATLLTGVNSDQIEIDTTGAIDNVYAYIADYNTANPHTLVTLANITDCAGSSVEGICFQTVAPGDPEPTKICVAITMKVGTVLFHNASSTEESCAENLVAVANPSPGTFGGDAVSQDGQTVWDTP